MNAIQQRRRARRIEEAAAAVAQGSATGPDEQCSICRRRLTDEVSVARAIGPVCWEHVLNEIGNLGNPAAVPLQGELRV